MPAPVLQFKRGNAGVAGTVPALRPGEPAISLNNFDFFVGIDTTVANNKFFGSHRYWGREDGTNSLRLKLVDKDGSNYVAIKSPNTLAGIVTYVLPGTQGGTQTVLTNDGSGNLSWSSGSLNAVFSGITTVNGSFLDVNVNTDFSGITTFSNTTDNTLGDPNTGAVQIDGGLGVDKNVTIGAGLSVTGQSSFIGTVTFYSGTINLGNEDTDDIVVAGEFKSNLIPSDDATYSLGTGSKRWKNASFSGIGTFDSGIDANNVVIGISGANEIDTTIGKLSLSSANGVVEVTNHLDVLGDIDVQGNVYIGGTTVVLRGTDVFIENKDIVLGYTTTSSPNDTSANHAGVAIASTEGTPLASFSASGINTLPDTYKQMMWFKSGTLGFATDAFAFNYGVAIGTTTMASGTRLAVGSGVTITNDTVNAVSANFTNLSVTNLTGSLTGTISTATRAITVDTTGTSTNATYFVPFVDTLAGQNGETLRVGAGLSLNPSDGSVATGGILSVGNASALTSYIKAGGGSNAMYLFSNGNVAFQGTIGASAINSASGNTVVNLSGSTASFVGNVSVAGITTVGTSLSSPTVRTNLIKSSDTNTTAITISDNDVTVADNLTVGGNLYVNGSTTQVNTSSLTVEDRTIQLGVVDGSAPSSATTWDLGVLFNYYTDSAKQSAVVWEHADARFKFGSVVTDGGGTDNNSPQLTVGTYAPIEIGALWVNDCAGQSQVISCTGTERFLENITIDGGQF
jgi:hypothetical protein